MRMNDTCYNDHLCQKDASHSLTSKSFISPINGTKEMLPKYRNLKTKNNTELWFQALKNKTLSIHYILNTTAPVCLYFFWQKTNQGYII